MIKGEVQEQEKVFAQADTITQQLKLLREKEEMYTKDERKVTAEQQEKKMRGVET